MTRFDDLQVGMPISFCAALFGQEKPHGPNLWYNETRQGYIREKTHKHISVVTKDGYRGYSKFRISELKILNPEEEFLMRLEL